MVEYDKDLFDILSKIKVRENNEDKLWTLPNLNNLSNGNDELSDNKLNQLDTSKTVEEKIDYMMENYGIDLINAEDEDLGGTGYSLKIIAKLLFEIAKGENNFGCELITAILSDIITIITTEQGGKNC